MPGRGTAARHSDGWPPGSAPRGALATANTAAAVYVPFERFGDLTGMFAHGPEGEAALRAESRAPFWHPASDGPPRPPGTGAGLGPSGGAILPASREPPRHPGWLLAVVPPRRRGPMEGCQPWLPRRVVSHSSAVWWPAPHRVASHFCPRVVSHSPPQLRLLIAPCANARRRTAGSRHSRTCWARSRSSSREPAP